jgi:hypothetical protein
MQRIQFKIDDNYLNIILTLLDNLKIGIVKEFLELFKISKNAVLQKAFLEEVRAKIGL